MTITLQTAWLSLLSIPIACVAWTLTHPEVFREPREYCSNRCSTAKTLLVRNFFASLSVSIALAIIVTVAFLFLTNYKLLMDDWRGYIIAGFALVWIANVYISVFNFLRQDIKKRENGN